MSGVQGQRMWCMWMPWMASDPCSKSACVCGESLVTSRDTFVYSAALCRVRDPVFRIGVIDCDAMFALPFVGISGLLGKRSMTLPNPARQFNMGIW